MNIESLCRKDTFLKNCPPWAKEVWPSKSGLTWFIKDNRQALLARGAIFKLGRDWFVVSDRFLPAARELVGLPEEATQ